MLRLFDGGGRPHEKSLLIVANVWRLGNVGERAARAKICPETSGDVKRDESELISSSIVEGTSFSRKCTRVALECSTRRTSVRACSAIFKTDESAVSFHLLILPFRLLSFFYNKKNIQRECGSFGSNRHDARSAILVFCPTSENSESAIL